MANTQLGMRPLRQCRQAAEGPSIPMRIQPPSEARTPRLFKG